MSDVLTDWGVTQQEAADLLRQQVCPACGSGPWVSPLTHAAKAHGIDRYTMREACGLNTTESLAAPEFSARISERERKRGRDMQALSVRPRKDYRHTTAGLKALTDNLAGVSADQSRANLARTKTPEAQARRSATISEKWAAMSDEERARRTAHTVKDPRSGKFTSNRMATPMAVEPDADTSDG